MRPISGRHGDHARSFYCAVSRRGGPLHRKLCKAGSSDVTVFHEVTRARGAGPQSVEATRNKRRRPAMSHRTSMTTPAAITTILAIDLGKFKPVACRYDPATGEHAFQTIATTPPAVHDALKRFLISFESGRGVRPLATTRSVLRRREPAPSTPFHQFCRPHENRWHAWCSLRGWS